MRTTYFCGGRIILPHRILTDTAVAVEGERIAALLPESDVPQGARRVELGDAYLCPGFVDIHVHGGGGADFMDATPEAFRTVAHLHALHGTTSLCPTTMTCPNEQLFRCFDAYLEVLEDGETDGADFLGLHLEGPYLSGKNKGAQPTEFAMIPTEEILSETLARSKGQIVRWDAAPELQGMDVFAATMKKHGILCSIAHSAATATETLEAYQSGFTHITHLYCATTTEHKVDQVVHGGIVEATYLEDGITAELIADGCHIPKETMQLGFRLKGDCRLALITDAMRAAGTNATESVLGDRCNGVPVLIEGGVAKLLDRSSYAGSIATMDHALRTAHLRYGIPLCDTVRAMTLTPATLVGAQNRKGSIEVGKDADFVVLSPDFTVEAVYVRAKKITG